jgi:hypothetical protein
MASWAHVVMQWAINVPQKSHQLRKLQKAAKKGLIICKAGLMQAPSPK